MIECEARWLRMHIIDLNPAAILNFGCGTIKQRSRRQRFQTRILWNEWEDITLHIDKRDQGDIIADLEQPCDFRKCDLVLCTSLLEHVRDTDAVMKNIAKHATRAVLLSMPNDFPHHSDPIDTDLRMNSDQLAEYGEQFGLVTHTRTDLRFDGRGDSKLSIACVRFDATA